MGLQLPSAFSPPPLRSLAARAAALAGDCRPQWAVIGACQAAVLERSTSWRASDAGNAPIEAVGGKRPGRGAVDDEHRGAQGS